MISGERIRQARELRRLTQIELAAAIGVNQSAIAHFEANRSAPSAEHLKAIAAATGFPVPFFEQPPPPAFPVGSLLFRAHADMTARDREEAHRYGEVVHELSWRLREMVRALPVRLPRGLPEPVEAAQLTRAALGLGPADPIRHLVDSAERSGVLVLAVPVELDGRDAFSAWVGETGQLPVIVICNSESGERLRFSVAHELGHLVMHSPLRTSPFDVEKQADQFSAELLLPAEAMTAQLTRPVTLESLAVLKPTWGVSIQALIRRARDLDVISDRQYRSLFTAISRRGWRTREPIELPIEKPRALRKMLELVYGQAMNHRRIAEENRLSPLLIKRIVDSHAAHAGDAIRPRRPKKAVVLPMRRRSARPERVAG